MDFKLKNTIGVNFINLSEKEKEIVRGWRNSESIRRWMYTNHVISAKEHADFIKRIKNDPRNLYWLLRDKRDYIGVIYLNRVDLRNKNAYLGIYANPRRKLAGAGRTLVTSLKDIAFKALNLHTLKLEVLADNQRAIRFYKKFGFKKEGRLNNFVIRDGIYKDVLIMGINK